MNLFGRRERKRRKLDCLPQRMPGGPSGLNAYEACYYSQNGEDGIVAEIFRRIGTTDRYVVELGVEDGRECNSANPIRHSGWSGVLIEGDAQRHARLGRNYRRFPRVRTHRWDDTTYFGASLCAMTDMHNDFGYALVAIDCNVVNAFFLRRELLGSLHPVVSRQKVRL